MIKSLLMGCSLALAPLVSAMAADFTFTVTNEQTSDDTYTADMLVQYANGAAELVPFISTATGQYNFSITTPGGLYTPPGQASFAFWGPGADGGHAYQPPGGGGGSPPPGQMLHGVGDSNHKEGGGDGWIQNSYLGRWIIRQMTQCLVRQAIAEVLADYRCEGYGGVLHASYGICGGNLQVTCLHENPFDPYAPEPVQPNPPGSGGGGGGGYQRLVFTGFSSQLLQGTVTVGDVVNDDTQ